MRPHGRRGWWIGTVLAVAAGLFLSAPRASADDCATHLPSLGGAALPFASGPRSDSQPTPCPCHGPNCHKVPADPAPPPAPPPSSHGQESAWLPSSLAPSCAAGAALPAGDPLRTPFFSPAPLERPPR